MGRKLFALLAIFIMKNGNLNGWNIRFDLNYGKKLRLHLVTGINVYRKNQTDKIYGRSNK